MKIKSGFELREVCGQSMILSEGKENLDFSNIISMNDSAALLWKKVYGKDFTAEDLADILQEEYQIDDNTPLPREVALKDAHTVSQQWIEAGIVEE